MKYVGLIRLPERVYSPENLWQSRDLTKLSASPVSLIWIKYQDRIKCIDFKKKPASAEPLVSYKLQLWHHAESVDQLLFM